MSDAERARALELAAREQPRWANIAGTSIALVVAAVLATPGFAAVTILLLDGLGLSVDAGWTLRVVGTIAVVILASQGWAIFDMVAHKARLVAQIEMDVGEGLVEVLRVESAGARKLALDMGGRDPILIHDVGDGALLCTRGAHLVPLLAKGSFPTRAFTLVRLPATRLTVDLLPTGEGIPFETVTNVDASSLKDGEVVRA